MSALDLEGLLAAIAEAGEPGVAKVACFDADHTLWRGDLGDLAFQTALAERTLRAEAAAPIAALCEKSGLLATGEPHADARRLFEAYTTGEVPELDVIAAMVVCFAGYREDELVDLGRAIFAERLAGELYAETEAILAACASAGLEIRVISGTAHWLVVGAALALGIPPAAVAGARSHVVAGRIGAEMAPPVTYREGKTLALDRFAEGPIAAAFGDSLSDLFLLGRARLKVGVNPRPGLVSALAGAPGFVVFRPAATKRGDAVLPIGTDRVIA